MKRNLVVYLWVLVLSICITANTHASTLTQCNSADLVINRITINNISGNSVNFSYRIKNAGLSTLYLNRMRFELYLSQDNTLDEADIAAGGAFFGNNAPALDYDEVYNGSFTCNTSTSLRDYPYLIMSAKVRTGYSMPECFTTNVLAKYLANNFTDLEVDSLIRNVGFPFGGNTITYIISNKGRSTLDLSKMQYRVYYSIDNIYDMNDPIAAANTFDSAPLQIAPGGYKTDEILVNPPANSQYRYMIFMVVTLWGEVQHELDYNNNRLIVPIRGGSARVDAFNVEQKNDELTLVNKYEAGTQTHYVVYSTNGQLMREGVFNSNESLNISDFTSGVYVVKITDGISNESHKFVVTK